MFYDNSFTKQPQDYLMNFVRNRIEQNQGNDNQDQKSFRIQRSNISGLFVKEQHQESSMSQEDILDNGDEQGNDNSETEWQASSYYHEEKDVQGSHIRDQAAVGSSCDDSFLQIVDQHLSNIQRETDRAISEKPETNDLNSEIISLSKHEISHCLLQNQITVDSIHVTNLLSISIVANIINAPFQFVIVNAKNKFIKKDQVQILLEPYQTVQIQFQIRKRESEMGNIYETLRVDAFTQNKTREYTQNKRESTQNKREHCQSKFLKFEITFVKPKLQVTFLGKTVVKRIQQHKIAHLKVYPNQLNQYFINLIFSQQQFSNINSTRLQRIQCQIEAKGYISVHPSSVILYQNEPIKILMRKLTQASGIGRTSVILIRPVSSSLTYVLGIKCMERKENRNQEENEVVFNKFVL